MVSLLDNNIKIIPTGAFNFSSSQNSQFMISLKGNQLASIEAGAFDGKFGEGSMLSLASNQLTRFESVTFEKILQQLAAFASTKSRLVVQNSKNIITKAFIFLIQYKNFLFVFFPLLQIDPFDCDTDPCHLAWIGAFVFLIRCPVFQQYCVCRSGQELIQELPSKKSLIYLFVCF